MSRTANAPRAAGTAGGRGRAGAATPAERREDEAVRGVERLSRAAGRPPAAGVARTVELRVRVTPDELAEIARLAAERGLTVSDWIRGLAAGTAGRKRTT